MPRQVVVSAFALLASAAGAVGYGWPFWHESTTLELPGTVETQEVRLGSKIGGRVYRVAAAEGEYVGPGRPLVYLESPELEARIDQVRARMLEAQAELARAEHGPRREEKAATRAMVDSARARLARVKAGPRPEEINQARSELEAAEADLTNASQEQARVAALWNRGYATPAERDEARAIHGRHLGRVKAARASLDLLLAGSRAEDVAEAEAALARAVADADLLEAGTRAEDVEAARARVDELRATLAEREADRREAVISAPEQALVEVLAVRPGDLVSPGQPVVRVLKDGDLWVKVFVPETDLGHVQVGEHVDVTIDSHPGRHFRGTVMQIASISEFTPRNVQSIDERRHQVFGVKVKVDAPRGVLKSGMAASVTLDRRNDASH